MAQSSTGKRVIAVVLLTMAVILGVFIFTQGMGAMNTSKDFIDDVGESTIDCVSYMYSIKNMEYAGNVLSFDLRHESYSDVEMISSVTVVADSKETVETPGLIKGISKKITFENIIVGDNFTFYPDNCASFPVVCDMGQGRCR